MKRAPLSKAGPALDSGALERGQQAVRGPGAPGRRQVAGEDRRVGWGEINGLELTTDLCLCAVNSYSGEKINKSMEHSVLGAREHSLMIIEDYSRHCPPPSSPGHSETAVRPDLTERGQQHRARASQGARHTRRRLGAPADRPQLCSHRRLRGLEGLRVGRAALRSLQSPGQRGHAAGSLLRPGPSSPSPCRRPGSEGARGLGRSSRGRLPTGGQEVTPLLSSSALAARGLRDQCFCLGLNRALLERGCSPSREQAETRCRSR